MCIFRLFKLLPVSSFHLLQVKFEILLVSPQARGLKEGRTEVKWFLIFKFYLSVYGFVCFVSFVFGCFGVVVFCFVSFFLACLFVCCRLFFFCVNCLFDVTVDEENSEYCSNSHSSFTVVLLSYLSRTPLCSGGGRFDPAPFFVRVLVLDGWIW